MKIKSLFPFISSLILLFVLVPLGSSLFGHHIKLGIALISYSLLTYYFLSKAFYTKQYLWIVIQILIPLIIVYVPFCIWQFKSIIPTLPSTVAHFVGVWVGWFAFGKNKIVRYGLGIFVVMFSFWAFWWGFDMWLNKRNYGTYTNRILKEIPEFKLTTINGRWLSNKELNDKITVLDFWNNSCGVCFKKFPQVQAKFDRYKQNSIVNVYTVNIPIKGDSIGQAQNTMSKLNYRTPALFAEHNAIERYFGIVAYPTVVVLNKKNQMVYKGDIEGIDQIISELIAKEQ